MPAPLPPPDPPAGTEPSTAAFPPEPELASVASIDSAENSSPEQAQAMAPSNARALA
jgi:hypothetical protein